MSTPGNAWRRVHGAVTGRPTNFSWLIKGALAGSGRPTSAGEVEWLRKRGVKAIVTMTEDPLPAGWVAGLDYLHVPTVDLTAPTVEGTDAAVAFIRERVERGEPAMVHCAAGLGRAGTILACYLVRHEGMAADEAVEAVRERRPGSIQSDEQERAVEYYERHVASNRAASGD